MAAKTETENSTHVLQFNTFALFRPHVLPTLTLLMPSPSASRLSAIDMRSLELWGSIFGFGPIFSFYALRRNTSSLSESKKGKKHLFSYPFIHSSMLLHTCMYARAWMNRLSEFFFVLSSRMNF